MKYSKKIKLKNIIFLLVILKSCSIFGQKLDARTRVVIDVGHGGFDPGAIGTYEIQEKDVVLNIAKEIVQLNKVIFDDMFDLFLTRYDDRYIALGDRSHLAKALHADYFISLHCNAGTPKASGMEVFAHPSPNSHKAASVSLGHFILEESVNGIGIFQRGIKFANFQVLRDTRDLCPAVLIEVGFITNPDESQYFSGSKNIRALALAILMGLYQQIIYK